MIDLNRKQTGKQGIVITYLNVWFFLPIFNLFVLNTY